MPVLWEKSGAEGLWRGHSDNYLSVRTVCEADLFNRITPTRLVGVAGQELEGEVRGFCELSRTSRELGIGGVDNKPGADYNNPQLNSAGKNTPLAIGGVPE